MISQSEQLGATRRGVRRAGEVSDLMGTRGPKAVADLLGRSGVSRGITEMLFPEIEDLLAAESAGDAPARPVEAAIESELDPEMEGNLRVAAAREEAYALARGDAEVELTARLTEERRRVDRMRVEFARDRQRFFSAAESQVVKLALAVASRVLAREVTGDGMHLRSTVKAALARVQDSSATSLRVPVDEVEAWTAVFQRGSAGKVKVVGDERMTKGECVLETTVGRVELGVDVQMSEVERGFGELLQGNEVASEKIGPERVHATDAEGEKTGTR